jgi:hypothetical protein
MRPSQLGSHEGSVTGTKEKLGVNQRAEKSVAGCAIQAPQALRLCSGQTKAGHLDVFAPHTSKHLNRLLLRCHVRYPLFN